jgi:hypothetical protein
LSSIACPIFTYSHALIIMQVCLLRIQLLDNEFAINSLEIDLCQCYDTILVEFSIKLSSLAHSTSLLKIPQA